MPTVRAAVQQEFDQDLDAWRCRIRPILIQEPRQKKKMVGEIKERYLSEERIEKVTAEQKLDDQLILNLTQFQAYHGFWNRLSDEDAAQLFAKTRLEQGFKNDVVNADGTFEAMVAQADIVRLRASQGTRTTTGTVKVEVVDQARRCSGSHRPSQVQSTMKMR